ERMRERGAPHVRETGIDVRRLGIRVELDVLLDDEWRGAALDTVPVALEVDAPQLIGDEFPGIGVQGRVAVEVDDRRRPAVGGGEREGIDANLSLLKVPVRPHRPVLDYVTVGGADVDRRT